MIAALTIDRHDLESNISRKFARGNFIAIINKPIGSLKIIENPFLTETKQAGIKLLKFLTQAHNTDTFIAYELGYRTQQLANAEQVQLIIIENKQTKLRHITDLMEIDIDKSLTIN